ncbi:hypothetical protein OIU76_009810 [Salix suchowensis]|nr:hypothetical protein OIU76_009810 [Salix suchowensis]
MIHTAIPRLVLHLHDDDLSVRQACRNTLKRLAPLMEMEESTALFNSHRLTSDHRSDYQDFVRDLTKQFIQHLPSRIDTYMASTIQANAIYLVSCLVSLSDDQRILSLYQTQVFGMLMGKMSRSPDATVRAACSSALGLLLKSTNSLLWRTARQDLK